MSDALNQMRTRSLVRGWRHGWDKVSLTSFLWLVARYSVCMHTLCVYVCIYIKVLVKLAAKSSPWVTVDLIPSLFVPTRGQMSDLPQTVFTSECVFLLQGSLMIIWSDIRWNTWVWWSTWGWDELALHIGGNMNSSCKGEWNCLLSGQVNLLSDECFRARFV